MHVLHLVKAGLTHVLSQALRLTRFEPGVEVPRVESSISIDVAASQFVSRFVVKLLPALSDPPSPSLCSQQSQHCCINFSPWIPVRPLTVCELGRMCLEALAACKEFCHYMIPCTLEKDLVVNPSQCFAASRLQIVIAGPSQAIWT